MSYHNKNIPGRSRRKTNAQGKTAPRGYHYMPDGTLMSDTEHARLYSASPESSANCYVYYGQDSGSWLNKNPPGGGSIIQIANSADKAALLASNGITGVNSNGTSAKYGNKAYELYYGPGGRYVIEFIIDAVNDTLSFGQAYTFSYNISSVGPAWGIDACMKDANTMLIGNSDEVAELQLNSSSGTFAYNYLFTVIPNWYIGGGSDMVYRPSDDSIFAVLGGSGGLKVHQYSYSGTLLDDVFISPNPNSNMTFPNMMFCYGGKIFIHDQSNGVYEIETNPLSLLPSTISYAQPGSAGDAASSPDCCGVGIPGCTDPMAQNYDPTATVDDGSCIAIIYGCMDTVALNYYGGAQVDDGSCCYTSFVYPPGSNIAVCVGAGCTDPLATNYDPTATPDDGSCIYPPPVNPCNDPWTNTPALVQTCCEWCDINASTPGGLFGPPPQGCFDWMCDCCKPPIIKDFDLDLSDIPAAGERRTFTITGDGDGEVEFKLEIKDKDTGKYYNFVTNLFQTTEDSLEGKVISGKYRGSITFPAVTGSDDQYDIYLYAKPGTKHADHTESRFGDGSLDINGSIGSNSLLMQKVIYQYDALTLTLHGFSPNGTVSGTIATDTISVGRGKPKAKTPFSFTATAAATAAYRVLKQPVAGDVLAFVEPVIGATPVNLPGEDIYPAVSNTDTVNGAVTSGTTVTMDTAVASKMAVGDRVTGNSALSATTATVVSLDSTYVFTLSEAIAIADGITLSFSNQMNYSWPISNYANILNVGMIIVPGTNVTSETSIGTYQDTITIFEDTIDEKIIIKNQKPALSTLGEKPTVVKGLVTVQRGQITFDRQQVLALAGDTLKIGGYGESEILRVHGWEVKFTDLAIALTAPTTTTTEATSAHATIAVADREGIINTVSTVSGIGINPAAADPTLTTGGGLDGAGDWIMSAVQTLESGVTLTVENTGRVATITGNIQIIKAGTSDRTLRFDVEKLLSNSAP